MTEALIALIALLLLVLAAVAGYLFGRLRDSRALAAERLVSADLRGQLAARTQQAQAAAELAPIAEALQHLDLRVEQAQRERVAADAVLRQQLEEVRRSNHTTAQQLQAEARKLGQALSRSHVRGTWGESELRRLVEAAGMLERVHFDTQQTVAGKRPDMLIHLAGGGEIVVDAKAPLDALLASPEEEYSQVTLQRHAKALRERIDELAKREYGTATGSAGPELVMLFLPAESMLSLALSADPGLLEHGFNRGVVLATPTTLLALLRTAAAAWRQESVAANAREVHALAVELYRRLSTMSEHLSAVGKGLDGAVKAYNKAVGSYESRVLVQARKFCDLGVTDSELPSGQRVETPPRELTVDLTERAS